MRDLGFERVRTEPTTVSRWIRGDKEVGRILSRSFGSVPVPVRALGGSIATPTGGITAAVLEVKSIEELQQAGEQAKGKIIFLTGPWIPPFLILSRPMGQRQDRDPRVRSRQRGPVEWLRSSVRSRSR